ncbi:MAG: hypothetical protein IKW30_05220 [Lachnospiraceae bacterium]|nr:hypothetical protein [Lachnospiraceae bacterium]
MKNILNKRFELWNTIWIMLIMFVEYIIGEIWNFGIGTLLISIAIFLITILLTELLHKKRYDELLKKNMNEFVSDAEMILREYGEPLLEQKELSNKIDKVVLDVYKLNYYARKLKLLVNCGDDRVLDAFSKGEKVWNNIKGEYINKENELEHIILQSAKLTWLIELINKNKESDEFIFPLRYRLGEVEEEYTAETLVKKQRKGQKTVFIADGGYGKTWTVERMARIYAEQYVAYMESKDKGCSMSEFPVFVKVGDIKKITNKPIYDKMKEQLCNVFALQSLEKVDIPFEILGNDVLFVDALDEARDAKINTLIIEEMNQYQNTVIFTTRPTEVAYLNELSQDHMDNPMIMYRIADVNMIQVRNYLEKELSRKEKDVELTDEEIESILEKFENSGFAEKCISPFLLHCFVNTVLETKKNSDKIFDIGENLNKLYGAFIAGIIERERNGKSLRGLISVDEVLRYLNKFAVTIVEKGEKGLSGVEAALLAKEYFGDANFDGRNLENAENDINISLREMHIFTVEGGKYKFISNDFMYAVFNEEQIDEILMLTSRGMIYRNDFLNIVKLKLDKILSGKEVEGISNFLGEIYERGINAEQALVLIGESMTSVNSNYLQEQAHELYVYGLVKWIGQFEEERKRLHYAYERSYFGISQYFTTWIIGKTKEIQFSRLEFEDVYGIFVQMISMIQRVNELKRHVLTPQNIEDIINAYGNNDYPKYLWLKERFANYEYSVKMSRTGKGNYNYPKNLEVVCKNIINKIDSGFEFYDKVLEIEVCIKKLCDNSFTGKVSM